MSITLLDVQTGFGGFTPGQRELYTAESLAGELRHAGIQRALARIIPDKDDFDIAHSNELLYEACRRNPSLIPCPVAAPDLAGDLGGATHQISEALANGAVAVALRPVLDHWLAEPWVCDDLMCALASHNLPAFCAERLVPLPELAKLAQAYPDNIFILAEVNYRSLRTLLPLLKHFNNIYLSTGNNFTFHYGYETFAKVVGTKRLLFGTGLPDHEAGAALGHLMYSGLTSEQKADIAFGNFNSLIQGVRK